MDICVNMLPTWWWITLKVIKILRFWSIYFFLSWKSIPHIPHFPKMPRNFGTFCTFLNLPHFTHTNPTLPTLFPTPCKESKSEGESGKSRFHFSHMRKPAYFRQFLAFCKENVGECGNVWEMVFEILPHIKPA